MPKPLRRKRDSKADVQAIDESLGKDEAREGNEYNEYMDPSSSSYNGGVSSYLQGHSINLKCHEICRVSL